MEVAEDRLEQVLSGSGSSAMFNSLKIVYVSNGFFPSPVHMVMPQHWCRFCCTPQGVLVLKVSSG